LIEVSDKVHKYLQSLYGTEAAGKYLDFIKSDPSQYIRVNLLKISTEGLVRRLLTKYNIKSVPVAGIKNAIKIQSDSHILGKTLEHILGYYYIQGLSSMLPPLVLNPSKEDLVLDLCSAPGSKTTSIAEMMESNGTLLANEIAIDRVKMLVFNIDRMNLMNTAVLHFKGEQLSKIYNNHFDKILVDAPCSGLGIIQKKGEVNNWWSIERASKLGDLQLRLLIAAIKMVKQGGEIIYSTCTLTVEENEAIINKALRKYPVELKVISLPVNSIDAFSSFAGEMFHPSIVKARRILPWEVDSDGFFIAKFRKTEETQPPENNQIKPSNLKLVSSSSKEIKKYLSYISQTFGVDEPAFSKYKYIVKAGDIYFVNAEWDDDNLSLFERIGTRFGVVNKNGELTLHTQAAEILNKNITKNIYEIADKDELKIYLDGGIIKKQPDIKNQCAVKYEGMIIGTAVVTDSGIKSRFPRAKRTQEIFIA